MVCVQFLCCHFFKEPCCQILVFLSTCLFRYNKIDKRVRKLACLFSSYSRRLQSVTKVFEHIRLATFVFYSRNPFRPLPDTTIPKQCFISGDRIMPDAPFGSNVVFRCNSLLYAFSLELIPLQKSILINNKFILFCIIHLPSECHIVLHIIAAFPGSVPITVAFFYNAFFDGFFSGFNHIIKCKLPIPNFVRKIFNFAVRPAEFFQF
mmetsp:Transcript_5304/g.3046  ORF Transcript_5304/g.3046 Transcript_5304/m.3046 type:complete len:207 (-) Transcript_5304:329-949(-)